MEPDSPIYCSGAGTFYACTSGSQFVGCCESTYDACDKGCLDSDVRNVAFDPRLYLKFPDASCGTDSSFYTCSNAKFWGCCKSIPCSTELGCPSEDLIPAYMEDPPQVKFYSDLIRYGFNLASPPVLTRSGFSAPTSVAQATHTKAVSKSDASVSISIALSFAITGCVGLAVWLCYRRYMVSAPQSTTSSEDAPLPMETSSTSKDNSNTLDNQVHVFAEKSNLFHRLGMKSLCILISTIFVELILCGILMFLWFGNSDQRAWNHIMVHGWVTQSVAITALLLRTATDVQAAIGAAILAALLLEFKGGINLYQVANISPMRAGTAGPWSFAYCAMQSFWQSKTDHRGIDWKHTHRNLDWRHTLTVWLLITSSALQFSSTILLADLRLGELAAPASNLQVRPGLSYQWGTSSIPRDSAWSTNPSGYPIFGEYHEAIQTPEDGIFDTGLLLRALLPFKTVEDRLKVFSYSGNAMVLDARVSCQAPQLTRLGGLWSNTSVKSISGLMSPSKNSSFLTDIQETPFDCALGSPDDFTICQISRNASAEAPHNTTGSLKSQFFNSSAFGTAFLVLNHLTAGATEQNAWRDIDMTVGGNKTSPLRASLCFASWDSAILNVTMVGEKNRSEPSLQYRTSKGIDGYETQDVLHHLLPVNQNESRPILALQKLKHFVGDLPPPYRRPVVQSDVSGNIAAKTEIVSPLSGNRSALLTSTVGMRNLQPDVLIAGQVTVVDPALAAIFKDTLNSTSIEWAMSSLITVLSMTNYYGQQPAFDRVDDITVAYFKEVLYPQDRLGLMMLMWALAAHIVVMLVLVVAFVRNTRLTLLGNAWSNFMQVAESPDVMEHMAGGSELTDAEVSKALKETQKSGLRARFIHRGEGAEVVVR